MGIWLKLENQSYIAVASNTALSVESGGGGPTPYRVTYNGLIVKSGFATAEDAQAVLDTFMAHIGFVEVN